MSKPAKQIEDFRSFAKKELKNHLLELKTKYQNREPASKDIKQEAYREHRQIFVKKLTEKMEAILADENRFLQPALNEIKEKYVQELQSSTAL
jgi:superoxide dismutase